MNDKTKKTAIRRLKIIEGQVRGLQKMIDDNVYCVDIITQTSAVKKALSGVEDVLLETHLSTCLVDQVKSGKEKKAVKEILEVYKIAKKK